MNLTVNIIVNIKIMIINKFLDWELAFNNEIDIEDGTFNITIKKDEVEIECCWD